MRPSELISRIIFNLIPIAVAIGLCCLAIWILRRAGPSKPPRAEGQATSPLSWPLITTAVASFVMILPFRPYLRSIGPLVPVGAWLATYGILLAGTLWLLRDRDLLRATRLAGRGDLDGAIAVLRPAVARAADPGRALEVAADPADPWAPPRGAIRRDARLAKRINLMGVIQALQGDWPAALECYRRAEAIGGPTPIFRSNIGRAQARLGATAEGFATMRTALADAGGLPPLVRSQMATSFALGLAEAGHHAEACARLDEAIAALRAARICLPATRRKLEATFARVRDLLSLPAPGEPGLDAGGDRG